MTTSVTLIDLLPSTPYLLAYALPLLFISLFLTFAGTFLTLDRSRSFVPNGLPSQIPGDFNLESTKKARHFRLYLEGGFGGILIGYSFGLHSATFLSLLIPNESSSAALGYKPFVAVWILSSIPTAVLGGRFKYAALTFAGITGGTALALALAISFHPALLTRRVLVALFVPILTLVLLLPFEKARHHALRLAANATGTFGLILSTALLANATSWADIWQRLWLNDGEDWGTTAEHGLSAAFWIILIVGAGTDFLLNRYFGTNPDEKWDSYLSDYAHMLPNSSDRAGTFQPLTSSFWDRIFHPAKNTSSAVTQPLFTSVPEDIKDPLSPTRPSFHGAARGFSTEKLPFSSLSSEPSGVFEYEKKPAMLRKPSDRPFARLMALNQTYSSASTKASLGQGGRRREAVKFRPLGDSEGLTSDEEEEDDNATRVGDVLSIPPPKRRLSSRMSSSKTLTTNSGSRRFSGSKGAPLSPTSEAPPDFDFEKEKARIVNAKRDAALEYSDHEEEDVIAHSPSRRDLPGWTPPFIERHRSTSGGSSSSSKPTLTNSHSAPPPPPPAAAGAVPMTPSLMYALDRVAVAQRDAFVGASARGAVEHAGMPNSGTAAAVGLAPVPASPTSPIAQRPNGKRWDSFWKEVTEKAGKDAKH